MTQLRNNSKRSVGVVVVAIVVVLVRMLTHFGKVPCVYVFYFASVCTRMCSCILIVQLWICLYYLFVKKLVIYM